MIPLGHPEGYDAYITSTKHFLASHACASLDEAMTLTKGHFSEEDCERMLKEIDAEMTFFRSSK